MSLVLHCLHPVFNRSQLVAPIFLLVAGCGLFAERPEPDAVALPFVTSFASAGLGSASASGWRHWAFSRFKKPTRYELVTDGGHVVVKATADRSASGLRHRLKLDPFLYPVIRWRWKVDKLIASADNTRKDAEDSPVRILVTFDGDVDKLPFDERLVFDDFHLLTGQRMPYATLVYIWENRVRTGSVIPNAHTSRIKMIVAESGRENLGRWRTITRNVVDDFRRAFGEEPGTITSVGIMTDTDNTRTKVQALYGDIEFRRVPRDGTGDEK